ncbi:hypothetical protein MHYP_G00061060 [Metynnis hypsauchen]
MIHLGYAEDLLLNLFCSVYYSLQLMDGWMQSALINFDCEAHEDIECTSNILDLRPVGCGSRRVSSGPCPFPPVCAHAVHAAAMWNYG